MDTDQILPGYAMAEPWTSSAILPWRVSRAWTLRAYSSPAASSWRGRNFGCGSSREQAPIALKQVGVSLVMAKGFARIFRRNSINIGMPVWVADIADSLKTGDTVEVDLEKGTVTVGGGKSDSSRRSLKTYSRRWNTVG